MTFKFTLLGLETTRECEEEKMKTSQQIKFTKASKHCKGKKVKAFRNCMKKRLKK